LKNKKVKFQANQMGSFLKSFKVSSKLAEKSGASHLKVHELNEKGMAGEQSVFALDGILFLQLHGLSDEHSMAW
jgi:hypothetical protein